ncbi:MAG: lycopene cyclase domain-containing protein [Ferruginibacter sp.]
MNTHYTYFLILAASIAGPLALSFDKKVAFYKKWKYLFPAILLPSLIYIVWDIFFTAKGVWSFNENYITGFKIANLPIEEVLFFIVVPYCCVFIYECIKCYFPKTIQLKFGAPIMIALAALLLITGCIYYDKYYTSYTFIFTAASIVSVLAFKNFFTGFSASLFLVAYAIIVIPFLIVNGFLTAIPVVLYNDAENLGIRIITIPFEDVFYGMTLVLLTIAIFEKLRAS